MLECQSQIASSVSAGIPDSTFHQNCLLIMRVWISIKFPENRNTGLKKALKALEAKAFRIMIPTLRLWNFQNLCNSEIFISSNNLLDKHSWKFQSAIRSKVFSKYFDCLQLHFSLGLNNKRNFYRIQ